MDFFGICSLVWYLLCSINTQHILSKSVDNKVKHVDIIFLVLTFADPSTHAGTSV